MKKTVRTIELTWTTSSRYQHNRRAHLDLDTLDEVEVDQMDQERDEVPENRTIAERDDD